MGADRPPPQALQSRAEVEALVAKILPGMSLVTRGVSHVAAGVAREGRLELFRVGHARSPKSRWDRFALDVSRLRAEAIVITGSILREEPSLSYAFDPGWAAAFVAVRRELGVRERPLLVVLTRAGIDLDHPVFDSNVEGLVLKSAPSLADAIEVARGRGARSVSVEAGPRVARELYEPSSSLLDELIFHRFEDTLPSDALVGAFASEERVQSLLGAPRSQIAVRDGSTRSILERYAR